MMSWLAVGLFLRCTGSNGDARARSLLTLTEPSCAVELSNGRVLFPADFLHAKLAFGANFLCANYIPS